MMWIVYLLRGVTRKKRKKRYYVGSTNSIERRLSEHRSGKSSYGRTCKNINLAWIKQCKTEKEARSLERYYKKKKPKERAAMEKEFITAMKELHAFYTDFIEGIVEGMIPLMNSFLELLLPVYTELIGAGLIEEVVANGTDIQAKNG